MFFLFVVGKAYATTGTWFSSEVFLYVLLLRFFPSSVMTVIVIFFHIKCTRHMDARDGIWNTSSAITILYYFIYQLFESINLMCYLTFSFHAGTFLVLYQ